MGSSSPPARLQFRLDKKRGQRQIISFDGLCDNHRTGGGILHYDLVLSATEEVLGTGSTGDLSLTMFLTLASGVALWVVYGFLKSDMVIILAYATSLALQLGILLPAGGNVFCPGEWGHSD
jgi:uncharacterized protein with PQ loop repeat